MSPMMLPNCDGIDLQDDQPTKCRRTAEFSMSTDSTRETHNFCVLHLKVWLMMNGDLNGMLELLTNES